MTVDTRAAMQVDIKQAATAKQVYKVMYAQLEHDEHRTARAPQVMRWGWGRELSRGPSRRGQ
eukprot:2843669-Alexandrium_andersonii.AAC.1